MIFTNIQSLEFNYFQSKTRDDIFNIINQIKETDSMFLSLKKRPFVNEERRREETDLKGIGTYH